MIQRFPANLEGRDFVIGDLHGCYEILQDKMSLVNFDKEKDRIFSVGDLVDRGPDSVKCLSLVFEPWFHSVLGNHEEMMFCGLLDRSPEDYQCWVANGGIWHLDHIEGEADSRVFEDTLTAYREVMPLAIEVETKDGRVVGILHADPPKKWEHSEIRDKRRSTLWGRERVTANDTSNVEGIDDIYVGHTPAKKVKTLGNVHYIDTGANWTGKLSMLEIGKVAK